MLQWNQERGNASLASVFGLVAVLGLYVTFDQHKTQGLRAEVLSSSLSSMAKQANENALSRTKSLLKKNGSGLAAVNIQNKAFTPGGGAGFQIQQGALLLESPDPRADQWVVSPVSNQLTSRVVLEKVVVDGAGIPLNLIAVAETSVQSGSTTKSHRTRARIDLVALNAPASNPPAGNSPAGNTPANSGGVRPPGASGSGATVASNNAPQSGGPCGAVLSAGNSSANSTTGANTSNSAAQGQNTGSSAQTTGNSASGCAASQTGGNTAIAVGSGSGGTVTTNNTASTNGNSSNASSNTTATGTGSVNASSSASATAGGTRP